MSILDRYLEYADAFEESFVDDDWSRLEPYFSPDAIYDGEPAARGREALLAKLKTAVDNFDRRMDSRTLDFAKPAAKGDTVTMKWSVTYTKKGLPNLVISGLETARFEGDRIALLHDDLDPEAQKALGEWMTRHGPALQG
ncbi:MAG TPA: nuclear transport factor 2 family protein [Myxococcota bacterium]|nr:nuclear transport factor 2 family protein [Myxococcota bacterium]